MGLEKLLHHTLQVTPDSFGIFDADNRLLYCNDQFAEIFAVDISRAIGMSQGELMRNAYESDSGLIIDTDDFEAWVQGVEYRQRMKPYRYFESDLKDGRWFRITQVVLDDDHIAVWGTDITELKNTKRKLKQALDDVNRLARIDELTGVYNRRAFLELAQDELLRSVRFRHPFTIAILDIDFFKKVNDTYGHAGGDEILKFFADFFQKNLRETDIFARFGGEEFILLLTETDTQASLKVIDALRQNLSESPIGIQSNDQNTDVVTHISCSVGLQSLSHPDDELQSIINKADEALYRAKNEGRNCCRIL